VQNNEMRRNKKEIAGMGCLDKLKKYTGSEHKYMFDRKRFRGELSPSLSC
jgi:hypothetical protein